MPAKNKKIFFALFAVACKCNYSVNKNSRFGIEMFWGGELGTATRGTRGSRRFGGESLESRARETVIF